MRKPAVEVERGERFRPTVKSPFYAAQSVVKGTHFVTITYWAGGNHRQSRFTLNETVEVQS